MPVIIIDNYDSFTYNLYQLVQSTILSFLNSVDGNANMLRRSDRTVEGDAMRRRLTDADVQVHRNDAITFSDLCSLKPTHVIISPGPGHPANASDFGICSEVVTKQEELNCPVLGVCLGHQGIVQHLGGNVVRAPEIVHGKTSQVQIIADSPIFEGMPRTFEAMRYHSLVAEETSLPPEITVTARESRNSLVMALQHTTKPLYGVQFHPESIGTPEGVKIMRNFLEKC